MAAEPGPGPGADPELDELLDSALADFEKPPPAPPAAPGPQPAADASAEGSFLAAQERFFQELLDGEAAAQAAAEFERAMRELQRDEPRLLEQFRRLSEAAGRVGGDAASQREFTSCLKETLSGLARDSPDLQGPSEEEVAKALEGLGLEEAGGPGGVLPVVQGVVQSLLSRELLYPSLKEITDKYPEWLRVHGPELPPEQCQRYRAQLRVLGSICRQLESERPGEGEQQRQERFRALIDLMQQLQDLGHPPKELAGDSPPGFNLEVPGGGGDQCPLM